MLAENKRTYDQLMELQKCESFHQKHFQTLLQAYTNMKEQSEALNKSMATLAYLRGQMDQLQTEGTQIDEQSAKLRYAIDLWIRRYNANHPPVQYEELENTFNSKTDWEAIRSRSRQEHIQKAAEEMMVRHLSEEIASMQAIASRCSTSIHELTTERLNQERKALEEEYARVVLQTAKHQIALQRNKEIRQSLQTENQTLDKLSH